MYSLWLTTPTGDLRRKVQTAIQHFSQKHNAPVFAPHVTLVGEGGADPEKAKSVAQTLAKQTPSVFVKFHDVSYKADPYFQCVFILCAPTEDLLKLREAAMREFGFAESGYVPHLSLLYSDTSEAERKSVVQAAVDRFYNGVTGMEDEMLSETGFWAEAIEVWKVDVEDKSLKGWECIGHYPLLRQE